MDSERKQEDDDIDDYVIKPHNHNSSEEQRQHNSPEKMKRRDVPTLKTLAQLTHERHLNTNEQVDGVEDANNETGGDNNNKIIKQLVELRRDEPNNLTSKLNGVVDKPVVERQEDSPNDASSPGPLPAVNGNGGEAIATSSGRTSSCDSSGIGPSLTTSSSSEPIEREGVSPTSEQIDNGPVANDGNEDEDVPDNSNGGGTVVIVEDNINVVDVPNGDINDDSDSCQALLLAHDFNEQMTAAKRFLKMVRDGIDTPGGTSAATGSSRLKGADSSTDEDATVVTSNKSAILSSSTNSSSNINGCAGTTIKDKSGVSGVGGGGRSVVSANKISNPVLLPVQPSIHIKNPFQENGPPPNCVQEVWAHNLLEEFAKIRRIVKTYTFIAMVSQC